MNAKQATAFLAHLDSLSHRHEVVFEGVSVTWRHFGAGPVLVLLHGGHGQWLHWARNIEALARYFSVWVPDMPGFGESDEPAAHTLSALVDAIQGTLDRLIGCDTTMALVGFSFGGLAAGQLAASRAGVHRLALLGAGGQGEGRKLVDRQLIRWRPAMDAGDERELSRVMRHNLILSMFHESASADALADRIYMESCFRSRFRTKDISRAGGLASSLDIYRGQVLLVWGQHDPDGSSAQLALGASADRNNISMRIVPDAGHWVQYERADEINRILLSWLGVPPRGE